MAELVAGVKPQTGRAPRTAPKNIQAVALTPLVSDVDNFEVGDGIPWELVSEHGTVGQLAAANKIIKHDLNKNGTPYLKLALDGKSVIVNFTSKARDSYFELGNKPSASNMCLRLFDITNSETGVVERKYMVTIVGETGGNGSKGSTEMAD
jgi:hypothetical protein